MKKFKLLAIGLLMVLLGSFFANMVQTQSGDVKMVNIAIAGEHGEQLSAYMFIPTNATKETPAPAIVTVHGYLNQKETQSNFSVEFARRGYVVLELDMSGHGSSEQVVGDMTRGVSDALKYIHSVDFVDKNNVSLEGHSMGGWSVVTAAAQHKDLVHGVLVIGSAQGNLPLGNALGAPEIPQDANINFGVIFAKYDEFVGINYFQAKGADFVKASNLMEPFGTDKPVELGKIYGSFEDGTGRVAYTADISHVREHQSKQVIGDAITFMNMSSPAPVQIDSQSQIWQWKELSTAIVYIGLIVFMLGVVVALFQTLYFGTLVQKVQRTALHSGLYTGACALIVILTALIFLPLNTWGTNHYLANWKPGNPFSQVFTNNTMLFLGTLQVIFLVIFLIWHFAYGKKHGENMLSYGLATKADDSSFSWGVIGKSFLIAMITIASGYILLGAMTELFKVDARYWMLVIRTMNAERFWVALLCFLPFLAIFGVNNFITFGWLRLKDFGSECKNLVIGTLATFFINALGIIILIAIQIITTRTTGQVCFASGTFDQLLIVLSYGFIPLLGILSIFSNYSYRKTGNIYTGAFISAMLVTWFLVCYQPVGQPFYM